MGGRLRISRRRAGCVSCDSCFVSIDTGDHLATTVDAIKRDLANRSLVKIRIEDLPEGHLVMAMAAVFRTDRPPGPGRALAH